MPDSYRTCSVDGCEEKHSAKGFCGKHYMRFKRNEDLSDRQKGCFIENCESKHFGKGFCKKHYERLRRHGSPLIRGQGQNLDFLKQIIVAPSDNCIIWPTPAKSGYGRVYYLGSKRPAHRVSLILYTGKDPVDLYALHGRCHNPSCVNPLHLRWGTPAENNQDQLLDGTRVRGKKVKNSKLTEKEVLAIKKRLKAETPTEIARSLSIKREVVSNIKHGRGWAWLE